MTLTFRGALVNYFIECPSVWVYLTFISWLDWGYRLLRTRPWRQSAIVITSCPWCMVSTWLTVQNLAHFTQGAFHHVSPAKLPLTPPARFYSLEASQPAQLTGGVGRRVKLHILKGRSAKSIIWGSSAQISEIILTKIFSLYLGDMSFYEIYMQHIKIPIIKAKSNSRASCFIHWTKKSFLQ